MRFALDKTNKSPSLEGHLLIASPRMLDPKFHRAVILVLNHNENGAMGVVLNCPLPVQCPGIVAPAG